MSVKQTKREALNTWLELWTWLAKNPNKEKGNWPGWDNLGYMECDCPACNHNDVSENGDCSLCILSWTVPISSDYKEIGICTSKGTEFCTWSNKAIVGSPERTEAALAIVKLCETALKELDIEEGIKAPQSTPMQRMQPALVESQFLSMFAELSEIEGLDLDISPTHCGIAGSIEAMAEAKQLMINWMNN